MNSSNQEFLQEFCDKQFSAVIEERVKDIISHYNDSPDTYVFVEGPRWSTLGFEKISTGWNGYGDSPIKVKKIQFVEGPKGRVTEKMAWIGHIINMTVDINGEKKEIRFRGTFVIGKNTNDEWKIEHEHFSQPASDPYGTGDWLKEGEQNA